MQHCLYIWYLSPVSQCKFYHAFRWWKWVKAGKLRLEIYQRPNGPNGRILGKSEAPIPSISRQRKKDVHQRSWEVDPWTHINKSRFVFPLWGYPQAEHRVGTGAGDWESRNRKRGSGMTEHKPGCSERRLPVPGNGELDYLNQLSCWKQLKMLIIIFFPTATSS